MDSIDKRLKSENLEVTGVSRSGRVRKKSSKLMDFESPDEVENKYKRKQVPELTLKMEKNRKGIKIAKHRMDDDDDENDDDDAEYEHENWKIENTPDSDSEGDQYKPGGDDDDQFEVDDEEEDDDDDDDDDFTEGNLVVDEKAPTQSIYMMEKSRKKLSFNNGKVVASPKGQRSDKGKTRFTAYMMWAKEVRQALSKQFPDMDFSTMNRRLSEMWATVPNSERQHWKRRAKREGLKKPKTKTEAPLMPSRKFINKKGGPIAPLHNTPVVLPQKPVIAEQKTVRKPVDTSPTTSSIVSKTSNLAPIDVAAHLKLLGESLSIIGERLQEHEGQIAVSGSLSVLLDSLLCAMGPLLCLTQQIDKMHTNPETLSKILNNTAYIMPGLG